MILETELENKIIDELSSISDLSSCQFIGSRQTTISDEDTIADDETVDTIIAIHTGYRQNDAFSLPTITVPVSIQITTRIERDKSGQKHEKVIETISDTISYWHKFSNTFTSTFTLEKMFCGELTMNGGSGRAYDKDMEIWTENITFSIRGSEKFSQATRNGKWTISYINRMGLFDTMELTKFSVNTFNGNLEWKEDAPRSLNSIVYVPSRDTWTAFGEFAHTIGITPIDVQTEHPANCVKELSGESWSAIWSR